MLKFKIGFYGIRSMANRLAPFPSLFPSPPSPLDSNSSKPESLAILYFQYQTCLQGGSDKFILRQFNCLFHFSSPTHALLKVLRLCIATLCSVQLIFRCEFEASIKDIGTCMKVYMCCASELEGVEYITVEYITAFIIEVPQVKPL